MKNAKLSDSQLEILKIINSSLKINGTSPSLRDILNKSTYLRSLRGVALQLDSLVSAGYISRTSRHKSIEITNDIFDMDDKIINIPFFTGTVQAGIPSFFEEFSDSTIPVKLSATKGLRNVSALKVRGESMIDAGIDDGDYAIITQQVGAINGEIVVALTSEGITLKIYRLIHGHPILFPANKNFRPIVDNFEIKGRLVNVLKPQMVEYFRNLAKLVD